MPTTYNKVTAGGNTIIDLSQDTVTLASHIMAGFVGHLADGTQVTGTGSGGSGGLVYESGTYTPASNTARPELTFSNTHTNKPLMAAIYDVTNTEFTSSNMNAATIVLDWEGTTGNVIDVGADVGYGLMINGYRSGTNGTFSNNRKVLISDSTSSSSGTGWYLSNTAFKPGNTSSQYYQAGRTYKWLAVWPPTT